MLAGSLGVKFGVRALRALGVAGALLCFAATWWQARSGRERASVAQEMSQTGAALDAARKGSAPMAKQDTDFVLQLPASSSADAVVRDLQRACGAASVTFVSFAAADRAPTAQALGRLELRAALRGPYGGAKSVINEVMARQPSGVVQRLSMRQGANASDLDTQIDLLLLTRPLPGPAIPGGS